MVVECKVYTSVTPKREQCEKNFAKVLGLTILHTLHSSTSIYQPSSELLNVEKMQKDLLVK